MFHFRIRNHHTTIMQLQIIKVPITMTAGKLITNSLIDQPILTMTLIGYHVGTSAVSISLITTSMTRLTAAVIKSAARITVVIVKRALGKIAAEKAVRITTAVSLHPVVTLSRMKLLLTHSWETTHLLLLYYKRI